MKKVMKKTDQCPTCEQYYTSWNIERHKVACSRVYECVQCNKEFKPKDKDTVTCSYSCSNKYFRSGTDNGNWKNSRYRTTCFLYHEKKCVVCGEENIVAVHHFNGNHDDNDPVNLIPLCPTHHQYCHSRHYSKVQQIIESYIATWKEQSR